MFAWDTLCEIGHPILKTKKNNAEQKENQICMMKLSNIQLFDTAIKAVYIKRNSKAIFLIIVCYGTR